MTTSFLSLVKIEVGLKFLHIDVFGMEITLLRHQFNNVSRFSLITVHKLVLLPMQWNHLATQIVFYRLHYEVLRKFEATCCVIDVQFSHFYIWSSRTMVSFSHLCFFMYQITCHLDFGFIDNNKLLYYSCLSKNASATLESNDFEGRP